MSKKHKSLKEKKLSSQRKVRNVNFPVEESREGTENTLNSKISYTRPVIKATAKEVSVDENALLLVDPAVIKKDLLKTLMLVIVFLGVIFGLHWYINLGGATVLGSKFIR